MNTHDIELPKPFTTVYDDVDKVEVGCYSEIQVRAAIEADRQARGEPVGWEFSHNGYWIRTSEPGLHKQMGRDVRPLFTSPQPQKASEPVAVLHDDGHYTYKGMKPEGYDRAGWRMEVYAAPQPQQQASEPVGEVFTMEPLDGSGDVKCHALLTKQLPAGTKLYAAPEPKEKP